jgi:hypothetical protein
VTALINDRATPERTVKTLGLPVAVATPICFKGARACIDTTTGKCVPGKPSTTLVPVGLFAERVDNRAGAQTVLAQVNLDREIILRWYANDGTVTAAALLQDCYILDDQTVTMNPTGASKSGRIWQVDTVRGVAVETGAASSGNGAGADPTALAQTDWYVDEANFSGVASNSNSGLLGAPVLNWSEVLRRFGVGGTVTNNTHLVTVHYLSVPAVLNAFRFDWPPTVTLGPDMSVSVEAPAGVAVRTGTLTAATALVTTYGSAALATITDTGQVWTAGQRVTITAGARAGQSFWIVTGGTGTASITPCSTAYDIAASTITTTTPVAGDAYLLESNALPGLDIADLNIHYADRVTGNKAVVFRGFTINAGGGLSTHAGMALVIFDRCAVPAITQNSDNITFMNCWVTGTIIALTGMGLSFNAGYCSSFTISRAGANLLYTQDVVMGAGIGANVSPGTLVALDGVGFFCAGDGVTVGPGCTFQVGNFGSIFGAGTLYGAVTGTGANVKEGGRLLYKNGQLPTIKGTAADWKLPNAPAYFDNTGRTFPLATAGTPSTWANLAAAQPGGFGSGCAHDPDTDAHILKVA